MSVTIVPSTIKRCKFDNMAINASGHCMIMAQIIKALKLTQSSDVDVDLAILAQGLGNLIPRMTKTVMDIIVDYNYSNPEVIQIMGRANGAPYGGLYDSQNNNTTMDLKKFPDGLIIVLHEFMKLMKSHTVK